MNVLELMHALEEAYDRFGDIEVVIETSEYGRGRIKDVLIESEEVIIEGH